MQIVLVGFVGSLTVIEVLGTAAMTYWARTSSPGACILGVNLFVLLGLTLGLAIRGFSHMNTVNALWQSTSIACVSLLSATYFHETITPLQWLGVVLACLASLCFIE